MALESLESAEGLKARLAHVVWIGGATDSGKSSVARALAERHGWQAYHYDRFDRLEAPGHWARLDPVRHPLMWASRDKSLEARWVETSPEKMLAGWLASTPERFELTLEDLLALPSEPMVVAEGYGLLPELVGPLLSSGHQAVWLVSTERFKRECYAQREARGEKGALWAKLSDPQRARENHIGRDLLIGEHIWRSAGELGLARMEIDGARSLEEVTGDVERHLAPYVQAVSVRGVSK